MASVSGIHGVARGAVELPSQLLELWCWQPESLKIISKHYKTGKPLPVKWVKTMVSTKNFQAALWMLRQLEFALFDFKLHLTEVFVTGEMIQKLLNTIRQKTSCIRPESYSRFQHSFTHIFAGGYAAGYYSYLWADVLVCDVFQAFLSAGIFDQKTARKLKATILSQGGSEDAMTLFKKFRGRAPELKYLLKLYGLKTK